MSIQEGLYCIRNVQSRTYFEASRAMPGTIHGWEGDDNGTDSDQVWTVRRSCQGYTLRNDAHCKYASGLPSLRSIDDPAEWAITHRGKGYSIEVVVGTTSVAIELVDGKRENGALIRLRPFIGSLQQLWEFVYIGEAKEHLSTQAPSRVTMMRNDENGVYFTGVGGMSCFDFISAIRTRAIEEAKYQDYTWIAAYAATRLRGPAQSWYEQQDLSTRTDWEVLRLALLKKFSGESDSKLTPSEVKVETNSYTGPIKPGYYVIRSVKNNKAITYVQGKKHSSVVGLPCKHDPSQIWEVEQSQNGYTFKNCDSEKYMTYQRLAGLYTILMPGHYPSEFHIDEKEGDGHHIRPLSFRYLAVDLTGIALFREGAEIHFWWGHSGANQLWRFEPLKAPLNIRPEGCTPM